MQSSEIAQDCKKKFAIWTEGIFNILLVVSFLKADKFGESWFQSDKD